MSPQRSPIARYGLALAAAAVAAVASALIYEPFVRVAPFLLFYAAVAICSWYGGFGPGLLVTTLGVLAVVYFQQAGSGQVHLGLGHLLPRLLVFVTVGVLIAWLNRQLQTAYLSCEREAARSMRLASSNLVGICFADLDGRVRTANDAFLRIVGRSRDELSGGSLNWLQFTATEFRDVDRRALDELRQSRLCPPVEKELLHRDGTRVPVVWGCAMFDDSDREFINFVLDLTERKRAEEQVRAHEHRLRAMASELMLAEDRERRKIATVLHDAVGHTLALAKLKLEAIAPSAGGNGLALRVSEVQGLIDHAVQHTRKLTAEISPPVLYELGLDRAIQWLGERLQQEHPIDFYFEGDRDPKPLSSETRLVLFQAVRELLVNLVKHAHARTCRVTTRRADGHVEVIVEDDGTGFPEAKDDAPLPAHGGFGLFNIRERLAHLGGRMEIRSSPSEGSRVTLRAPLAQDAPDTPERIGRQ